MRQRRTDKRLLANINVVPYIDVMLVLLVIFMITAPLLTQGVKVQLPSAQAKVLKSDNTLPIVVTVDRHGLYYLNQSSHPQQPINDQTLALRVAALLQLATAQHKPAVYVRADQQVNYGQVVRAMSVLQHAGANAIGLMTQPSQAVIQQP